MVIRHRVEGNVGAKGIANHDQWYLGQLLGSCADCRDQVPVLGLSVIVDALRRSDAAKIEAKHGDAERREFAGQGGRSRVVHIAAVKRMRVGGHHDGAGVVGLGRMPLGLERKLIFCGDMHENGLRWKCLSVSEKATVSLVSKAEAKSKKSAAKPAEKDHDQPADGLPIKMLNDRILVSIDGPEGERRSTGGILIPATAQVGKRLAWAEVFATGPNVRSMEPGDRVLFNPDDRYEVEVRGCEYIILRERDVHAVAAPRLEGVSTGLYL